jgi:hypothetical protein
MPASPDGRFLAFIAVALVSNVPHARRRWH